MGKNKTVLIEFTGVGDCPLYCDISGGCGYDGVKLHKGCGIDNDHLPEDKKGCYINQDKENEKIKDYAEEILNLTDIGDAHF